MMIPWSPQILHWLAAFAFSSLILSAVALLVTLVQRQSSAAVRFTISQAAMTGILALAVMCAVLPGVVISPRALAPRQRAVVASEPLSTGLREQEQGIAFPEMDSQVVMPTTAGAKSEAPVIALPNSSPTAGASSLSSASYAFDLAALGTLIACLWSAGCLFLLARFTGSVVSAYRSTCRATLESTHDQLCRLERAIGELNFIRRPSIRLAVSSEIPVPYTMGMLRSVIVLPVESRGWSTAKTTMVLKHELAHIQRRDVLWCWINHVACSLAWFNPLVWVLSRRCVVQREQACDDLVLRTGAEPTQYGTSLVEIAASLSGRSVDLRGAVTMAEPPLKRRLAAVLAPEMNRQSMSLRSRWLVIGGFSLAVMILGSVRPIGQSAAMAQTDTPAAASVQDSQSSGGYSGQGDEAKSDAKPEKPVGVALPDSLSGRVHDPQGRPIAGARVRAELIQRVSGLDTSSLFVDVLRTWEITSDGSGRFMVDTSEIKELQPKQFIRVAHATSRDFVLARSIWLDGPDIASGETFELRMLPARRIIAHVLTSDLLPASGAVVKAAGTPGDANKYWWTEGEKIGQDGMLSIYVPVDTDVELLVYAPDHAPRRVKIGWEDSMLGQIVLQKGTRLQGKVLDRNGDGISGTVVQLRTSDGGDLERILFDARLAVKTDETGRFKLPPCIGKCSLSVTQIGRDYSKIGRTVVKGIVPPVMLPVRVELDGKSPTREVNLRQGPTATIEGVARWADGRPVVGMLVSAAAMGADISFATTGPNGRYKLEMPIPLEEATLFAIGQKDSNGVFHMAHNTWEHGDGHPQIVSLEPLEGDLQDVNWELKVRQPTPKLPPSTAAADRALQELRQQADSAMEAYQQGLQEVTAFNERSRVRNQLDPRNMMASPYLAMEQNHRGTRAGFQALVEVVNAGRSVGDPTSAAAQGRIEAIDRLIEHYIQYEELDDIFRSLDGGPVVPRADEFLQAAIDNNPHRHVQVAALMTQINAIKRKLRQVGQVPQLRNGIALIPSTVPYLKAQRAHGLSQLESVDTEQLRAEANEKINRLASQYGEQPLDYYGTAAVAAKNFAHAINEVVVGQPAPEIVAVDIQGKPFRLSDHRGKIVMLLFAQELFDNYAEYYKTIHRLATQYSDRPLEIVGIMSNHKQEHLLAAARRGDLPWTVIPQTLNGPVQRDWGIDGYPTVYLVDHEGTLHGSFSIPYGDLDYETPGLEAKIDELLSKARLAK